MSALVTTLKGIFSGDTLFLVICLLLFLGYAMFMGRGRIVSLLLSFYPATILFNSFPFASRFLVLHGGVPEVLNKVGVFLLFLIPISIVINRFVVSFSEHSGAAHFIRLLGFAVAGVALVLVFSYSTVSLNAIHDFSPAIDGLFATPSLIFYWNLGILAVLAFL
jgi:hypothetical protein